tara:strand:+ start:2291 stop:2668 length:378 start_codon:yes stop_codon:yes gene_type:complete
MPTSTKPIAIRKTVTVASVGTAWIQTSIVVPIRGKIRRVRASVSAGTAINQVKLEIRETSGGTVLNVPLAYALATQPLDSGEDELYSVASSVDDLQMGTLYIAVAVDNATTNHVVTVSLDIDVVA